MQVSAATEFVGKKGIIAFLFCPEKLRVQVQERKRYNFTWYDDAKKLFDFSLEKW